MLEPSLNGAYKKSLQFLVWDAEDSPPDGEWVKVLWSGFTSGDACNDISIPSMVEQQADSLKTQYLSWIYEFGEQHLEGMRLVDHLALRTGFSYWWMTSLAQKFNASATSQIDNAIKGLVFESVVAKYQPVSIRFVSANNSLATVLRNFCLAQGIPFEWDSLRPQIDKPGIARRLHQLLPHPLRAAAYFCWFFLKWLPVSLRPVISNKGAAGSGKISLIDMLAHLDKRAFSSGKFVSNYWTALVDLMQQSGMKTNWFHNFYRYEKVPSLTDALTLVERFSSNSAGLQSHALMEAYFSLPTFAGAIRDYIQLWRASYKPCIANLSFVTPGSSLDLGPLFRDEWMDSLRGHEAIVNCLRLRLYEALFVALPKQSLGIYILENQPWEMALIHAWKSAGHGRLVGVAHSTVRYGDLRYFYDARSYRQTELTRLPVPDLVALNGLPARRLYLDWGHPEEGIVDVEALRYLHLLSTHSVSEESSSDSKRLRVLVCGDFLYKTTARMMNWVEKAVKQLPAEMTLIFKPHPAYQYDPALLSSLDVQVRNDPVGELLKESDVVFASNITSVAVDAYCHGLPVIQMLDGSAFNMSPLRELGGVVYVSSPEALADALQQAKSCKNQMPYFNLNASLPKWRELLQMN